MIVLRELTKEYMEKFGYADAEITTVLHQWMGGFPQDEAKAYAVICWGSAVVALSKATKVIVKTPQEAIGVPTMEANAAGLRATKQMITMLRDQMPDRASLSQEQALIDEETRCIVDKVIEIGEGSIAAGVVRAFQAGFLDIPFAPSNVFLQNAGNCLFKLKLFT